MSDFDFSVTFGKVTITRYRGIGGDVVIPDTIDGRPVTAIGDFAFDSCTGLTSITLGNSITTIGSWAFSGCTGLTSITLGNSITTIGSWAFSGCTGLASITFGNSLTSISLPNSIYHIGYGAFQDCPVTITIRKKGG